MVSNSMFGVVCLLLALLFIGVGVLSGFMIGGERLIVGYMGLIAGAVCILGAIKAFTDRSVGSKKDEAKTKDRTHSS